MLKTLRKPHLISLFIAIILGFLIHATTFAQDNVPLISFTLKDQFNNEYTEASFPGKILVVIVADREGNKFSDDWQQAIGEALLKRQMEGQVQCIRVANLKGSPWFMHSFISGEFPKETDRWSLMDWKGIFAAEYNGEPKSCNILIFNRQQCLVYKTDVQQPDPQKLEEIVKNVK